MHLYKIIADFLWMKEYVDEIYGALHFVGANSAHPADQEPLTVDRWFVIRAEYYDYCIISTSVIVRPYRFDSVLYEYLIASGTTTSHDDVYCIADMVPGTDPCFWLLPSHSTQLHLINTHSFAFEWKVVRWLISICTLRAVMASDFISFRGSLITLHSSLKTSEWVAGSWGQLRSSSTASRTYVRRCYYLSTNNTCIYTFERTNERTIDRSIDRTNEVTVSDKYKRMFHNSFACVSQGAFGALLTRYRTSRSFSLSYYYHSHRHHMYTYIYIYIRRDHASYVW